MRPYHPIEDSHKRSAIGFGLGLALNQLELVRSEQLVECAHLHQWAVVVVQLEHVEEVLGQRLGQVYAVLEGLEGELVPHDPVAERADPVLLRLANIQLD